MPRYVGLLRGVNLGGANKVSMAELRALFESLGHTEVSTFIQSGNVLFTSAKPVTPRPLEAAIGKRFGIDTAVMLRTPRQLKGVVTHNPFPKADPSHLHVGFLARKATVAKLDAERFRPEEFAARGSELYFYLPNGMGRTKLPGYVDRRLGIPMTIRTWKTVTKLLDLA